jgi:lipopolysaccharide export system permease protein
MNLLDRYVFKTVIVGFLATLVGLTAVIWLTQALREFDLLTAKGQTVLIFLAVTGLTVPALVTIIAPVALFIATIYALNKLNGDSELIVMSAAGLSPQRLLRPFLLAAVIVSGLVAAMTLWAMPASFRELRDLIVQIRADLVTKVLREGQFHSLEPGLTFHYRERAGDGLLGIFIDDRRDAGHPNVYLAERGQTVEANGSTYLVLEKGSVQRQQPNSRDPAIVAFERYAIDLSQFGSDSGPVGYKPRERGTLDLLSADSSNPEQHQQAGRIRAELHDRFSAPLYPLAFMAIGFAALGIPRTTRQGRGLAIAGAIAAVVALRIGGFALSSVVVRSARAVPFLYAAPLLATVVSLLFVIRPAFLQRLGRRPRPAPFAVAPA